jgi:hypothetical protein
MKTLTWTWTWTWTLLVTVAAAGACAACGPSRIVSSSPPADAGASDATPDGRPPAADAAAPLDAAPGPRPCSAGAPCPTGETCLGGFCSPDLNAPAASSDQCAAQGLTRKTDLTALDFGMGNRKDGLNLKANEAYVLSFTAPATLTTYRQIQTIYSATTKLITISSDQCGFNTPLNNSARCSVQQDPQNLTEEAGPCYSLGTSTSYCNLTPGQTYYVNIRNAKPNVSPVQDSCTNAAGCGFSLTY